MIQHPIIKWLPLVAASLLLGACASTGTHTNAATSTETSHDVLKQRAQQRWDDLINKQADKAYDYLTPGYRSTISRQLYAERMNSRPVQWKSAKVHKVECEQAQKCTVYVSVTFTAPMQGLAGGGGARGFSPNREDWLLLRNQWYYLPREEGGSLKKAN